MEGQIISFCVLSDLSEHILIEFIIFVYIKNVYFMSVSSNKDLRSLSNNSNASSVNYALARRDY